MRIRYQLSVEDGRVICPVRGEMDVEECLEGPSLRRIRGASMRSGVMTCRPPVLGIPPQGYVSSLFDPPRR